MGTVRAVCRSEKKGTPKQDVGQAAFEAGFGMTGDAHAGNWHRQVSLLSYDKIEEFKARGAKVEHGAFGENLVVEGIDFKTLPVGTLLRSGGVLLEVTQIGKECHAHCEIHRAMGDCIMPREGIFAKVLRSGEIAVGDDLSVLVSPEDAPAFDVAILTASDKGARGEREDLGGPEIIKIAERAGYRIHSRTILPDDKDLLAEKLRALCDEDVALILTTGGTGFSPRDCTPEATMAAAERMVPGIPEAMRYFSLRITRRAMLSRAAAGIRGKTLIVNLPGSPKAARECLEFILPELEHGIRILRGLEGECARS